ncbi:MAG: hypothetical protein AAGA90_23920 [Actinomycetota bacterium]
MTLPRHQAPKARYHDMPHGHAAGNHGDARRAASAAACRGRFVYDPEEWA